MEDLSRTPTPALRQLAQGGSKIAVIGGLRREGKGEIYDPLSDSLSTLFDLRQPRLYHSAATSNSGRILITGGRKGLGKDQLSSAAFLQGMLEVDAPPLPRPRSRHGSASIDETFFVFGGMDGKEWLSSGVALRGDATSWDTISPMPTARDNAATIAVPGPSGEYNILVIGGYGGSSPLSTVEAFCPNTNQWTTMESLPLEIQALAGTFIAGRVYVCGGATTIYASSTRGGMWSLDPRIGRWEEEAPMETKRCGHCVVPLQGNIYALGGHDSSGTDLDTVEVFDPRKKSWTAAKKLQLRAFFSTASLFRS